MPTDFLSKAESSALPAVWDARTYDLIRRSSDIASLTVSLYRHRIIRDRPLTWVVLVENLGKPDAWYESSTHQMAERIYATAWDRHKITIDISN